MAPQATRSAGEVGRAGVAIDTVEDMERLFEAIGRTHEEVLGRRLPLDGAGVCGAAVPAEPARTAVVQEEEPEQARELAESIAAVATGAGPVLQPGAPPVEGFSDPTWMALLAFGSGPVRGFAIDRLTPGARTALLTAAIGLASLGALVADSADPTSLADLARRTKVVATTVGPRVTRIYHGA